MNSIETVGELVDAAPAGSVGSKVDGGCVAESVTGVVVVALGILTGGLGPYITDSTPHQQSTDQPKESQRSECGREMRSRQPHGSQCDGHGQHHRQPAEPRHVGQCQAYQQYAARHGQHQNLAAYQLHFERRVGPTSVQERMLSHRGSHAIWIGSGPLFEVVGT